MRRSVTPLVPPSLYRHFAVVTVLLTATLAMFAEGENRQAQAAPATGEALAATPPATRIVASHQAPPPAPGWWEVDSSSDVDMGAEDGDVGTSPAFEETDPSSDVPERRGSLSEDERGLLLAGMQESGGSAPE